MGSYQMLGEALHHILDVFKWHTAGIMFFNHHQDSQKGNSKCYFMMAALHQALGKQPKHVSFNESADYDEFKSHLLDLSKTSRSKYRIFLFFFLIIL